MKITQLHPSTEYQRSNRRVGALIFTLDPAEQALACAMYQWCDSTFGDDPTAGGSCCTHQRNVERDGYPIHAHCDGFDVFCSAEVMRKIIASWRVVFDEAELAAFETYLDTESGG